MSIWWKITTSAIARRPLTQAWIQQVAPPISHGGVKCRKAFDDILRLGQTWRAQKGVLMSQDYEKIWTAFHFNLRQPFCAKQDGLRS